MVKIKIVYLIKSLTKNQPALRHLFFLCNQINSLQNEKGTNGTQRIIAARLNTFNLQTSTFHLTIFFFQLQKRKNKNDCQPLKLLKYFLA